MSVFNKLMRAGEGKILRKLHRIADQVNSIEEDFVNLSDAELRALTDEYKQRYQDGESLDDLLPRPSRPFARPRSASSASATTTSRSWAAPRCTSVTSPR